MKFGYKMVSYTLRDVHFNIIPDIKTSAELKICMPIYFYYSVLVTIESHSGGNLQTTRTHLRK